MTDILGKTLGAKAIDRQIAVTLKRHGILPAPRLVAELVKVFEGSYEL